MLDGGVRFNILPCRQVMEDALGRLLSAVVVEANISWDSFRREGIGSVIRQRRTVDEIAQWFGLCGATASSLHPTTVRVMIARQCAIRSTRTRAYRELLLCALIETLTRYMNEEVGRSAQRLYCSANPTHFTLQNNASCYAQVSVPIPYEVASPRGFEPRSHP